MATPPKTEYPFTVPLSGKLVTSIDPLMESYGDFQKLVNLRYSDRSPKGVLGMTEIYKITSL
jgi:hypothetical protein